MATKTASKGGGGSGGGGQQKKAGANPEQEVREKEAAKTTVKEEITFPKPSGKKPPREEKKNAGQGSSGGGGRSGRSDDLRGRKRGRRSSKDQPEHRGRDKGEREVCRNFLHNRCDRGSLCKYYHPRSSSRPPRHSSDDPDHHRGSPTSSPSGGGSGGGQIMCRDFIRNMCTRGSECRFYHPPSDSSSKKRQGSWLTFCHDFRNGHCLRTDCRFFHITREDEESYRSSGEIPLHIIDQAVRKAMVLDAALTGTRPTCKEFLRGLCNMQNCRFRHLNQREYEDEVFHALQEEFEKLLGPPDRRPSTPQMPNSYPAPLAPSFHDTSHKYGASPGEFREEIMPPEDLPGPLMPHSEYESEPKRPRYFSGDGIFPPEEYSPRKWEGHIEYEPGVEQGDRPPQDAYHLMQEVYALRNENEEMRRNAEREIAELKEEVRRTTEENAGLRHEVAMMRAQTSEDSLTQKEALDKLTLANNTLLEDLRKAEENAQRMEMEGQEKLKALDTKQKTTLTELQHKLELLQKENAQMHRTLSKGTAAIKKVEEEKAKLLADLDDLQAKMRSSSSGGPLPSPTLRKDYHHHSQQHNSSGSGGYSTKNNYPRDMMKERGSDDGSGGGSYPELGHSDRRGVDGKDQDMRGPAVRGEGDRYASDAWVAADKNGRPPYVSGTGYGSSGGNTGYGMRGGKTDGDRSRDWHSSALPQDGWDKNPGGSLMGEYKGEERIRGAAHNSTLMRGPGYTSTGPNTRAGLLTLPQKAGDYSGSQLGLEGQYGSGSSSSHTRMHFEDCDYRLSSYDGDGRPAQYSSGNGSGDQKQRSAPGWQQGGGDGGQGWRRGKPF